MEKFECRLLSLVSYHQTEERGDEVFLKLKKKKVWPGKERYVRVNGSQAVPIKYTVLLDKLDGTLEFELWEFDNLLSSTRIGTFTLAPTEAGGPFTTDMKMTSKEFARYSLTWEVVRKGPKV